MNAQYLGRYREFRSPFYSATSIRDDLASVPQPFEERIVSYLEAGHRLIYRMGPPLKDVIQGEEITGDGHVLSDGTWVWRDDLAYYVKMYHVRIPKNAVVHMEANNWLPPTFDVVEAIQLETEVLAVPDEESER